MAIASWSGWIYLFVYVIIFLKIEARIVTITYIERAIDKGAVCLDGTPPAYHLSPGFDSGVNNWLVHLEGGGWCNNVTTCLDRKNTRLGSSKYMEKEWNFSAILSEDVSHNPDFYNWNRVYVRYCDGSSLTGDVETVDPATNLHYRGARIWLAVIDDLLAKGMSKAENALLSGCSAGGLASMLHCDSFHAFLRHDAKVKCLSDAGYFIHAKNIIGAEYINDFYNGVVTTHGSAKNLPSSCTSRLAPNMCFFPQHMAQTIDTPLFILNPAYDTWQIGNILVPDIADPDRAWTDCKLDIRRCNSTQLQTLHDFRAKFLDALASLGKCKSRGMFINSCYAHCQSEPQETWFGPDSPVLDDTTIAEAVGNWFYERSSFQKIDCPYPCDASCHNSVFA